MSYLKSISYSKAKAIVEEQSKIYFSQQSEKIDLNQALGRVVSESLIAQINVPPFANSAMDGFAIRSSDLPQKEGSLKLQEPQFAGDELSLNLNENSAIPITTGAMLPNGADTIVIKENSEARTDQSIYLRSVGPKGDYVRGIGNDIKKGKQLVQQGSRLKPQQLGILASCGYGSIDVYKNLDVVLLTSGDELAEIGTQLRQGQIYDSVQPALKSLLLQAGCNVIYSGSMKDDYEEIQSTLNQHQAKNTLIITIGGVSAGEKDFIIKLMQNQGEIYFHKTNIKPGFPLLFGKYDQSMFFGLPGNPVSSLVTFYQFVLPAIRILQGEVPKSIPTLKAKLTQGFNKQHYRREFVRGRLNYDPTFGYEVSICGDQGSGRLTSITDSNCFMVFDETPENYQAGDQITVQRFIDVLFPHLA